MSCYDKVFQKRVNLNVNFSRNWNEYKQGFGNLNGDFWLGELAIAAKSADVEFFHEAKNLESYFS